MREAAAAEEALLIDFNATEAGKMGGGGPGVPLGWVQPGQPSGAVGGPHVWMPPHAAYTPFPGGAYGPLDSAMSPPPPYGYPLPPNYHQQLEKPPAAASAPRSLEDEKKQPLFNIPPNNLGSSDCKLASTDNSPTGKSKPLNTNLQVSLKMKKNSRQTLLTHGL